MRVLSQGQTDLFDLAFSRLLEMDLTAFRNAFYNGGARAVALSCRAVGVDRAVFATVFNLSRQGHRMTAVLSKSDNAMLDSVFGEMTRQTAMAELKNIPAA
jgi:hypothetical protein